MGPLVRKAFRRLASRVAATSRPWRVRAISTRLVSVMLAMVVCLGSVARDLGSCRCLTTGQRMSRACCPDTMNGAATSSQSDDPGTTTISRRCCELVAPLVTEPVTPPERCPGAGVPPQLLLAVRPPSPLLPVAAPVSSPATLQPHDTPGDRLHELSTILRT